MNELRVLSILEKSGFERSNAEIFIYELKESDGNLATKSNLKDLETTISTHLKDLEIKISSSINSLIWKFVTVNFASITILFSFLKLFESWSVK